MLRSAKWAKICFMLAMISLGGCKDGAKLHLWDPHAPPEWMTSSIEKDASNARIGSINDIIDADGRCMSTRMDGLKQRPAPDMQLNPTAVSLNLSECEVVKRVGPPDRIKIGVNSRGERSTSLIYASAERTGVYQFTSGRLQSIER
jgi:hypothetical protein